jgi:hypothetical protein
VGTESLGDAILMSEQVGIPSTGDYSGTAMGEIGWIASSYCTVAVHSDKGIPSGGRRRNLNVSRATEFLGWAGQGWACCSSSASLNPVSSSYHDVPPPFHEAYALHSV